MRILPVDATLAAVKVNALAFLREFEESANQFFVDRVLEAQGAGRDGPVVLQPKAASEALDPALQLIESWVRQVADRHPSYAWLRYLRDLPPEFFAGDRLQYPSYVERRLPAEIVSSWSTRPPGDPYDSVEFPFGDCLHLVVASNALVSLRVLRRICAKEVPLIFNADKFPRVDVSHDNWLAVQTFDARFTSWDAANVRAGTIALTQLGPDPGMMPTLLESCVYRPYEVNEAASLPIPLTQDLAISDWAFSFHAWATRVPELLRSCGLTVPGLLEEMVLGMTVRMLVGAVGERALPVLARYGYLEFAQNDVLEVLQIMLGHPHVLKMRELMGTSEDLTRQQLVQVAQKVGTLSPAHLPGPLWRQMPNSERVQLDLTGHSYRLQNSLSLHQLGGGSASATRALDFERELQRLIDRSPWAPPPHLREQVGRRLKLPNGDVLTDLDCLAYRAGTGIFIDAKSLASSKMIEGDWGAIKDAREYLEKSWVKWVRQIGALEAQPRQTNYDFSDCNQFIPLLVTVAPQFTYQNLLMPKQLGELHPVSSMVELLRFLGLGLEDLPTP